MLAAPEVLVVDDSSDRSEIVGSLRAGGYKVTSAGTFEQATNIIASTPPDVLVTELRLGAFNGLHLIVRSRALRPSTVAIVYTAFPDPVLEAESRRLNTDYLRRPVDPSALLAVIAKRLGRRPERRASLRKSVVEPIEVEVAGRPAGGVDVSDDGLCIRLCGDEIRSPLEIRLPGSDLSISARIVWTSIRSRQGTRSFVVH